MDEETVTLFFALLSAVAFCLALSAAGVLVTGTKGAFFQALHPAAVLLAAAIGLTATVGSLYLSEVLRYRPCTLCWVQRFFMYSAAFVLVVAVVRRERLWSVVAGLLALLGLPVALFHRYEQYVGANSALCDADNPCSARWVNEFGFVTVPTMAAVAFAAMFLLLCLGTVTAHGKVGT